MLRVARAWRRVGSTEQVLFGGVRSVHSSGWTGAAAGAGDQRASSEDNAFVKARRAYQAELHELRKTFKQDVAQAQTNRQQKTDAARKAHNERIWSEKALRDAEKAKRAAENVAAQQEMMLQKVRPRGTRFHLISPTLLRVFRSSGSRSPHTMRCSHTKLRMPRIHRGRWSLLGWR